MKYFIITVDTEGDNLWNHKAGEVVKTQNSKYIPRFQALCQKYCFKPVYLTNYEMANDRFFVEKAKEWLKEHSCEVGVHLHAWNNPPIVSLEGKYLGNPYLIEYDDTIMREKFDVLYNLIKKEFNVTPVTHRAGRWAMDERYFLLLNEYGIKIDCSYTPGVSWEDSKGITQGGKDYTDEPKGLQWINGVMEVPVTIRRFRNFCNGTMKHRLKSVLLGEDVWLRPAMSNFQSMKKVLDIIGEEEGTDYVEFMIHSSELMPGGSPYFLTEDDVEQEYQIMEALFCYAAECGYLGVTLNDYYSIKA